MENIVGLLKIKVIRGIDLAKRDARSSDPYVVVRMGKQKVKTRVVKKNLNPEWNEELTLYVSDPTIPVKLRVYDKDTFSLDDKMGDAELDMEAFLEAAKTLQADHQVSSGTVISKIKPTRENNLSEASSIIWENGQVVQHMFLRLSNVECGEIELNLKWIHVSDDASKL